MMFKDEDKTYGYIQSAHDSSCLAEVAKINELSALES